MGDRKLEAGDRLSKDFLAFKPWPHSQLEYFEQAKLRFAFISCRSCPLEATQYFSFFGLRFPASGLRNYPAHK